MLSKKEIRQFMGYIEAQIGRVHRSLETMKRHAKKIKGSILSPPVLSADVGETTVTLTIVRAD